MVKHSHPLLLVEISFGDGSWALSDPLEDSGAGSITSVIPHLNPGSRDERNSPLLLDWVEYEAVLVYVAEDPLEPNTKLA